MVSTAKSRRGVSADLIDALADVRASWDAARPSMYRRTRTGLAAQGSGADYHYRSESDFLRIIETSRDFIRNDPAVGQGLDRVADQVQAENFQVEPKTSDLGVDTELFAMWEEWANDPNQADIQGERTFGDMARAAFVQPLGEGDLLYVGTEEGSLQGFEAHRMRTPQNAVKNDPATGKPRRSIVHGVEIDQYRKRTHYWVTNDDIDPMRSFRNMNEATRYVARDDEGDLQAFHVYSVAKARISQTRGISALAPIADIIDMGDDLRFAKLVQAKIVSCIAILRELPENRFNPNGSPMSGGVPATDTRYGARTTDSDGRILEEFGPGAEIVGRPGEKLTGFSPDVPNESFFQHSNLLLTFVAINLNLPLIVLMLDSTATNFSGYRGALDMARGSYSRMQKGLVNRFHSPVYKFKLKQFLSEPGNQALRNAYARLGRKKFFNHEWNAPGWRYIQPTEDAAGDILQSRNCLNSWRRIHAVRGQVWEKVAVEIVQDNDTIIRHALRAWNELRNDAEFAEIVKETGITWETFVSLPTPDRVSASVALGGSAQPAASTSRQTQEANAE